MAVAVAGGNNLLLIFGFYTLILNGIKGVLKLNLEYLPGIIIFELGILVGVFVTVRSVRYLLRRFRSQTIYCIIGLMIESMYAVNYRS